MKIRVLVMLAALLVLCCGIVPLQAQTPFAPCGVVDRIEYPIDTILDVTVASGYDDFGLFRGRFNGNHVGLDVGFREEGAPVYAAARGQVTYADIEGWDTERGVVIVSHIFPDGSRYYTVYGHLQEADDYRLPQVGDCVEPGDIIGAIGVPSLSLPHLHYEVRDFQPDNGGPGYISGNPLHAGWFHPLDFTRLWRARLLDSFVDSITLSEVPSLPPVQLTNGNIATASSDTVYVTANNGTTLWRVSMDSMVSGIAALSDNRVAAQARSGQVVVVAGGRYQALWQAPGPDVPFVVLDDILVFALDDGGLAGYDVAGQPLWTLVPRMDTGSTVTHLKTNGSTIGYGVEIEDGSVLWRVIDRHGMPLQESVLPEKPVVAPIATDGWAVFAGGELRYQHGTTNRRITVDEVRLRLSAQMAADSVGNVYIYLGDPSNTLVSLDADGAIRWSVIYELEQHIPLAPILAVDRGCLLYGLDAGGHLSVFNAADGTLVTRVGLYPGGNRTGRPSSRLLVSDHNGHIRFSGGFLSIVTLDSAVLAADVLAECHLG